jgi:hypothetical protein
MNHKKTVVKIMKLISKRARKSEVEPCHETVSIAAEVSAICLASAINYFNVDKGEQKEVLTKFMDFVHEEIEHVNNRKVFTA